MPIIKSAKKRVRVAAKAGVRNSKTRRTLREALKAFQSALVNGKAANISETHRQAVSAIDTAVKKNVIHKNKAARKKQQLATSLSKSGHKVLVAKKASPKPVVKKAVVKKIAAKAPVKKAVTKKPVAEKTVKKATKK